jgi:hypothetical protein
VALYLGLEHAGTPVTRRSAKDSFAFERKAPRFELHRNRSRIHMIRQRSIIFLFPKFVILTVLAKDVQNFGLYLGYRNALLRRMI